MLDEVVRRHMAETVRTQPFIDGHVHFREPGTNKAETIASGSLAAAYGGIGAVADMSNNPGAPTNSEMRMEEKHEIARRDSAIYYGTAAGYQPEYENVHELGYMLDRSLIVKMYGGPTTGITRHQDYEAREFDEGLDRIKAVSPDKLIVFHSGDENYRDFIGHAAQDRGLRVRLAHVNKMDQVEAVKSARDSGLDVRAEVCPQTLLLTSNDRNTRSSFADMQPPLVHQTDSERLFSALVTGDIHEIATDHAPHSLDSKMHAVETNPACTLDSHEGRCCGVPGVELGVPVMLWQVHIGRISMERLIEVYSTVPADSMRLKFRQDSYVEWDMTPYRIDDETAYVKSQARWTPYLGMMAVGKVINMKVGYTMVIRNGLPAGKVRSIISGNLERI